MKKLVVLLMVSLLAANVAAAVVDPDDNMIGVYFDLTADTTDATVLPNGWLPGTASAYVILTNPTYDALTGFEWGLSTANDPAWDGAYAISGVSHVGAGPIDMDSEDPTNCIVGTGSVVACSEATLLSTVTISVFAPVPFDIYLHGADPASMDPALPCILVEGVMYNTGLSTGIGNVIATVNGGYDAEGVVASEEASWDQVKSLYR